MAVNQLESGHVSKNTRGHVGDGSHRHHAEGGLHSEISKRPGAAVKSCVIPVRDAIQPMA